MPSPDFNAPGPAEQAAAPTLAPIFTGSRPRHPTIFEQIKSTPRERLRTRHLDDLPRILIFDGKKKGEWVLETWLHSERARTSWVAEKGLILVQILDGAAGETTWFCRHCDARRVVKFYTFSATSSPEKHLKKQHRIVKPSDSRPAMGVSPSAADEALAALRAPVTKYAAAHFKSDLLRLVVDADLSFTIVEKPAFRRLVGASGSAGATLLPQSGVTVKRWITRQYDHHFAVVVQSLRSRLSRIHVSFDLWSSPAMQAYISVVLYWVDQEGKRQTCLVAMQRVYGKHSGENQAAILLQIFKRLDIYDPSILGFFMADNADSCDTCVRAVLKSIYPLATTIEITALELLSRCRCIGHILNLAAKAFLLGEEAIPTYSDDHNTNLEVLRAWRKRGPVGKLHNLVQWVRRSPKRKDRFEAYSKGTAGTAGDEELARELLDVEEPPPGLALKSDNATRWNSTFFMILRAIKVRRVLTLYCQLSLTERKEEDRVPAEDILNDSDWQVLAELMALLQPLWRLTKRFEGNTFLRFAEVLPSLHLLQREMKGFLELYTSEEERRAAEIQDVIFVGGVDADTVHLDEVSDLPQPPAPGQDLAPDRPRRSSRLPRRFDDYQVVMPSRLRLRAATPAAAASQRAATVAQEPAPRDEDEPMPDDVRDPIEESGKAVIKGSIQLMIEKISKYEALLDDNHAGWASMVLDPRYKMRWIVRNLTNNRSDLILARFRDLYNHRYPAAVQTRGEEDIQVSPALPDRALPSFNALLDPGSEDEQDTFDEVTDYLAQPPAPSSLDELKILDWWLFQRERYPRLFSMAMDLLSIPAMSSENERSFSQAKLVITSQRHSLSPATIQQLTCLKAWNRSAAFPDVWEASK